MATSDGVLGRVLAAVEDDPLRRRLTEALSRQYTYLSDIGHRIFELAAEIGDLQPDDLRSPHPEVVTEELRRCEVALMRLTAALGDLEERLDDAAPP